MTPRVRGRGGRGGRGRRGRGRGNRRGRGFARKRAEEEMEDDESDGGGGGGDTGDGFGGTGVPSAPVKVQIENILGWRYPPGYYDSGYALHLLAPSFGMLTAFCGWGGVIQKKRGRRFGRDTQQEYTVLGGRCMERKLSEQAGLNKDALGGVVLMHVCVHLYLGARAMEWKEDSKWWRGGP